jgi:hypothetical protein
MLRRERSRGIGSAEPRSQARSRRWFRALRLEHVVSRARHATQQSKEGEVMTMDLAMNWKGGSKGRAPSRRRGRFVRLLVVGTAVVLGASLTLATTASAADCTGDPLFITDQCTDPRFKNPQIDLVEQRTTPVPHTFVHGFFPDTDARFAFYFPPPEQYEGRFILGPTHQLTNNENGRDPSFAFASGAYLVATNLGGIENPLEPLPIGAADTSIRGYRVNTAAARFSREKANELYAASHGQHRPYGYIYGGSGGSYMTICTLQQTSGVWDGGVPFISANHMATPYTYTVRILALRLLRDSGVNKFPAVMDAIDPGGSGDPLATLNAEQAEAFQEATRFGFPPRGWWSWATMTAGALPLVANEVPIQDPTYTDDFWNVPGYAGFDDPFGTLVGVRLQDPPQFRTVLANLGFGLLLDSVPPAGQAAGADLIADTGAAAGNKWQLVALPGNNLVIPFVGFGAPPFAPPACLTTNTCISAGDKVHIDNSAVIAVQYYNRHQDPNGDPEYYAWDTWRDGNGDPIHVQRDVITGLERATSSAGCVESGQFQGKMAVVNNLMDIDATPWYADWYRTQVKKFLGKKIDDRYRLYYNDHAEHGNPSPSNLAVNARTVSYTGMLQQTVRDVAAWVEQGVKPPPSTKYAVADGAAQIVVPVTADERKGLQPVVTLTVNGGERADISVGDTVTFRANIKVPPGAGKVVIAEWDFEGVGNYPVPANIGAIRPEVNLEVTHTYTTPGTRFPVLRAASQRDGDPADLFTRVNNIDRVRVVVTE